MKCPNCDIETEEDVCPECGTQVLSVSEDTLDALVEKASLPNLAAMFKKGQDLGLIKATQAYA